VKNTVDVDGTTFDVSLIDVTNPCVFIPAHELSLRGTELPAEMSGNSRLLKRLERIRGAVCERIGRVEDASDAATESPTVPFVAVVSPPQSYERSTEGTVRAEAIDITARIVTTQTPHHAYAMTGAMCLAAAVQLPDTVPNEVVRQESANSRVRIGHPKGTIAVDVTSGAESSVASVTLGRTARPIMDGAVYYRYVDGLETLV